MSGGQFDFVWLPARTPHGGASYVGEPNEIKKIYPPEKWITAFCACHAEHGVDDVQVLALQPDLRRAITITITIAVTKGC